MPTDDDSLYASDSQLLYSGRNNMHLGEKCTCAINLFCSRPHRYILSYLTSSAAVTSFGEVKHLRMVAGVCIEVIRTMDQLFTDKNSVLNAHSGQKLQTPVNSNE